jgi:hypothetical protein
MYAMSARSLRHDGGYGAGELAGVATDQYSDILVALIAQA